MTVWSPRLAQGAVASSLEERVGRASLDIPDESPDAAPAEAPLGAPDRLPTFEEAYERLFDFVWRSLRRLGVAPASIDDAVQDVFIVVHRRLPEFEGRSTLKTWAFGIALRVARDHQRLVRRKGGHSPLDAAIPDPGPGPIEALDRAEALRLFDRILATMTEEKRVVFVLFEVEELCAAEIAAAVGINVNTVYSRLRAARVELDAALKALAGGQR